MRKIIMFALVIFLYSAQAHATDWVLFSATPEGKHYYEKDSIERKGNILKVWTMSEHAKPRKDKTDKLVVTDMFLSEISCSAQTMKAYSITKVYEDRSSRNDYVKGTSIPVEPGSIGGLLLQAICTK